MPAKLTRKNHYGYVSALPVKFVWYLLYAAISRKVVRKMCRRQYRKVIWDMINTLFLTLQLSNLLLLLSCSTGKHTSMASRGAILSNFFKEQ